LGISSKLKRGDAGYNDTAVGCDNYLSLWRAIDILDVTAIPQVVYTWLADPLSSEAIRIDST